MTWEFIFQICEATDENDLDFAIAVFRVGTHVDNEEDRSDHMIDMAHIDMAHIDMAHIDMAHIDMAHIDMAHIDMAHIVE